MLLTLWGCKVCEAADGPAALDQAAAFHPDVILLDVCLPRLDGYAVARQVRQLPGLANVLLMALTGYGREEDSTRSREAGIDHHLVKPCEPNRLECLLGDRRAQGCCAG